MFDDGTRVTFRDPSGFSRHGTIIGEPLHGGSVYRVEMDSDIPGLPTAKILVHADSITHVSPSKK